MERIVITAPRFEQSGGWALDTQFVPTMGMPYLLAHGLGHPVEDAETGFEVSFSIFFLRLAIYTRKD